MNQIGLICSLLYTNSQSFVYTLNTIARNLICEFRTEFVQNELAGILRNGAAISGNSSGFQETYSDYSR